MTLDDLVRVDTVLGSSADDVWAGRLRSARVDELRLDRAEAQKSRLRKSTSHGTDVAVSLDRETRLRDGDVLYWDDRGRRAIVARVDLEDVMVIDLSALLERPRPETAPLCFRLGHALGNQHWAAVVKGDRVYVPVAVARTVMASVMRTHALGVTWSFVPGADVVGELTPNEARRLFGAADAQVHGGAPR